jgi:hypothetical protein
MKPFLYLITAALLGIALARSVTWIAAGQKTSVETHQSIDLIKNPYFFSSTENNLQGEKNAVKETILLWPKKANDFIEEYPNWRFWLGRNEIDAYTIRDELFVSVRALIISMHGLDVRVDEPDSDLIIVSGDPFMINALLERLRGHPLLEKYIFDTLDQREESRAIWENTKSNIKVPGPGFSNPGVNIRNPWVGNIVWGYDDPGIMVSITLTRNSSYVITSTAIADHDGSYHAYLAWDILDGDVIDVNDGTTTKKIFVTPLISTVKNNGATLSGSVSRTGDSENKDTLDLIVGQAVKPTLLQKNGKFTVDFSWEAVPPGTHGFLRYIDADGNRIYKPLSVPVINIRRDTSYGLPYDSAHMVGISSIVWGYSQPDTSLVITLTRSEGFSITRSVTSDQYGYFAVSMDRYMEDGDTLIVSDGTSVKTVQLPTMIYNVNPATKIVTGIAPGGITATSPGSPHSLELSIQGTTQQITTTEEGEFVADFSSKPYIAGLLGAMHYTTPDGDNVYKPIFVADPLIRGKLGDWRADVILGQRDFSQITFNEVVGNQVFLPEGVYVDKSFQPNRVYVYDSGNSRVLGLSHLGVCQTGVNAGQNCTTNSNCPGSSCAIDENRNADIVLGQQTLNTSSCNGDSGYQSYPDAPLASAETLCGLHESTGSVSEGGSGATMDSDEEGNLYVPDIHNNRILRYNDPFGTDEIADMVWGQEDFHGIHCNRGAGYLGPIDNRSLCLAPPPGWGDLRAGVDIDSNGNLWVADNMNNRVLRYPFDPSKSVPSQEADLVLGQPGFTTNSEGSNTNQMKRPASIRVDDNGVVFVADSQNGRVLVFEPPVTSGMYATRVLEDGLIRPLGLEFDMNGGIWVIDEENRNIVHFQDFVQDHVIPNLFSWGGGIGVDEDGNVLAPIIWPVQEIEHYSRPGFDLDARIFSDEEGYGIFNQPGPRGFFDISGLEIAAGQLIGSDGARILFWNNPWNLTNYQKPDGYVGVPDFYTQNKFGPHFKRMRADQWGHLWVVSNITNPPSVFAYKLPMEIEKTPEITITSPIPLQGGGSFAWSESVFLAGLTTQPNCDCLWLSDEDMHRVFRIRNASMNPIVDIVLGQLDATGTECNQGRGRDFPSQDSLCHPGGIAFDKAGNLFVADHNSEFDGNLRLLEFDANTIPEMPQTAIFGIPATRVYGRNNDFTAADCLPQQEDPMCAPWEPAFDSQERMVVGFNPYFGSRFPMVYQSPLENPLPIASLGDFFAWPAVARFDQFDNLYMVDSTRSRILIYRNKEVRTFSVAGTIKSIQGVPIPDVKVDAVGYVSSDLTDSSGAFTLTGLITGTYQLKPTKLNCTFTPSIRTVDVPMITENQNFTAICQPFLYLPVIERH